MKGTRGQDTRQSKQSAGHQPRPEIRDNLDSRANEEQDTKGDDVTNNHKDVHNKSKGTGKKNH